MFAVRIFSTRILNRIAVCVMNTTRFRKPSGTKRCNIAIIVQFSAAVVNLRHLSFTGVGRSQLPPLPVHYKFIIYQCSRPVFDGCKINIILLGVVICFLLFVFFACVSQSLPSKGLSSRARINLNIAAASFAFNNKRPCAFFTETVLHNMNMKCQLLTQLLQLL